MVLRPLAEARAAKNYRNGETLGSITNTPKFKQNNMQFVADLFKKEFVLPENEWFYLPNVMKMIKRLFKEARAQDQGKWQWRGFQMEGWEIDRYSHIVLRAFIAGGEDPWFD